MHVAYPSACENADHSTWLRSVVLLVALLFAPAVAFAQGKIAGTVTDAGTGDPLIGVNVVIQGTTQGTTTDVDGNYIILNVRPGTYSLEFSYIGFSRRVVQDVRVTSDHTTRIDVEMSEEVIEGEEIVVQAERPLIEKDLTASKRTFIAEEIDELPVEGFFGVLATQAGVTQGANGEFHIRGGRSNEIGYLVDGMSVGNPFNTNSLATEVAADAIQEMTVISGAFNAEYGKAMSGIVNLVTKEGGREFAGSVTFQGGDTFAGGSDLFGVEGFDYMDDVALDTYTLEGTLSGPLVSDKLRFFVSGRRDVDDGYIYGQRRFLPSDSANFNTDPDRLATIREFIPDYDGPNWYYEMHGKPWYEYVAEDRPIPSEIVPMNPRESFNVIGKVTFRPWSGAKIEYSHLQDGTIRTPFSFAYRFNPDGLSTQRDRSWNHSLHWTHTLNDRSFYTARFSYAHSKFRDYVYENPEDSRYVVDRDATGNGNVLGFPGNNFLFAGNQKGHVYEDATSLRSKIDFTRQFGVIHEAKAGIDVEVHYLERENFNVLFDGNRYRRPTVVSIDNPSRDKYGCTEYLDVEGVYDGYECEDQRAIHYAAYAQDKLEFEDFIINAGLRFERFEPNGRYIPDFLNPLGEDRQVVTAEADAENMVLPRIGVSFPITARGIIHFSYGHFAQMPRLRNMYLNPDFEYPEDAAPTFGNANLRPERTVSYEIGLQQQLTETIAFDVTGYFKDIRDYLTRQQIRYSTIPGRDIFNVYVNRNFVNVKGVTFALTKRRSRDGLVSANIDYTYQIAEGENDDPNAAFFNFLSGRENELEVIPTDFDQRHVVSSTVTVSRPQNWGVSLIGRFSTGYPYTPVLLDQNIDDLPRSGRKPSQIKLDAHLYRNVGFGGLDARLFAKVYNVLDMRNELFVFDETGRATYSLNERLNTHATWEPAYDDQGVRLPGVPTLDEWDTRPHYYSRPREVKVGLMLSF